MDPRGVGSRVVDGLMYGCRVRKCLMKLCLCLTGGPPHASDIVAAQLVPRQPVMPNGLPPAAPDNVLLESKGSTGPKGHMQTAGGHGI